MAAVATDQLAAEVYAAAEKLLPHNRPKLVEGLRVKPKWLDHGARFWYRAEGPEGHRFILVDPARGTRELAFDHARLGAALAAASGEAVDPAALPFNTIELKDGAVEFDVAGAHWRCPL